MEETLLHPFSGIPHSSERNESSSSEFSAVMSRVEEAKVETRM